MILRRDNMRTQKRPEMKGGTGEVTVRHLVECDDIDNIRYVGEMTLPTGTGIGHHSHEGETEFFIITEGVGIADDGDGDVEVNTGDVIVTGTGGSHSIRNDAEADLKIIAFIVTH